MADAGDEEAQRRIRNAWIAETQKVCGRAKLTAMAKAMLRPPSGLETRGSGAHPAAQTQVEACQAPSSGEIRCERVGAPPGESESIVITPEVNRAIFGRALKLLRCTRDGVPSLLGLSVVAMVQHRVPTDDICIPRGLLEYVIKLTEWVDSELLDAAHQAERVAAKRPVVSDLTEDEAMTPRKHIRVATECPICLDSLGSDGGVHAIGCMHTFCRGCIATHLTRDNRCPLCKYLVPEAELCEVGPGRQLEDSESEDEEDGEESESEGEEGVEVEVEDGYDGEGEDGEEALNQEDS